MRLPYVYIVEASNDNENWVLIKKFISYRKTFKSKKLKCNDAYKYWRFIRR